jgi:hypothetical protein
LIESSRKRSVVRDSKRKKRVKRIPIKRSGRSSETRNAKKRHSDKKRETSGRNRVVDREQESAGLARTVVAAAAVVVVVVVIAAAVAAAAEAIADHRLRDRFLLRHPPTAVAHRDHQAVVPLREGRSAAQRKILIRIAGVVTGNNPKEKESREAVAAAEV